MNLQNSHKSIARETETFLTATDTPCMNLIDNYDNFKLKASKNYVKDNIAYFEKLENFKRTGSVISNTSDET